MLLVQTRGGEEDGGKEENKEDKEISHVIYINSIANVYNRNTITQIVYYLNGTHHLLPPFSFSLLSSFLACDLACLCLLFLLCMDDGWQPCDGCE